MLFKSIKTTTTAFTVVAICLVCAVVLIFSIQENKRSTLEYAANELDALSTFIAKDLSNVLIEKPNIPQQDNLFKALEGFENIKYAAIFDGDWQQQKSYSRQAYNLNNLGISTVIEVLKSGGMSGLDIQAHRVIALREIIDSASSLRYVVVVSDLSDVLHVSTMSLLKKSLILLVILIILVSAVAFSMQRNLLSPIAELAKYVKDTDTHKDCLPIMNTPKKQEICELSDSINTMLVSINAQNATNSEHAKALKEKQKNIERLANFDALTGLPNRQFFMETLRIELAKAMRNNQN